MQNIPQTLPGTDPRIIALRQAIKVIDDNLSEEEKKSIRERTASVSIASVLDEIISAPTDSEVEEYWAKDKNSFVFWGPETSTLVKTPETLCIPVNFDTFKYAGMFEIFSQRPEYYDINKNGNILAAMQIDSWARNKNLDEIFLKNANFSCKHRWNQTCNIDFKLLPDNSVNSRVTQIIQHMENINSYAMLHNAEPGLAWVARKKLNLDPYFYAFGDIIYTVKNKDSGEIKSFMYNGRTEVKSYLTQLQREYPNTELSWKHIGMPITKELRVFTMNGDIVGYVPYWSPIAFKNQSVYGMRDNMTFDEALKQLNTFNKSDLEHVHNETKKITDHAKFHDTDWAIDWIKTQNDDWYMTDMQTANTSYMDYDNMIFVSPKTQRTVQNFMIKKMEHLEKVWHNASLVERAMLTLTSGGRQTNVDKRLEQFGYPNTIRLKQMKEMAELTK